MQLSDVDRAQHEVLLKHYVFEDVESHRLEQQAGVILVTCSDGDQVPDIFTHHCSLIAEHHAHVRIHLIGLNGGSLLLHPESPLVKELGEWRILHRHISDASAMKDIRSLALYAHAPCGAAGSVGLSLLQSVQLLMNGADLLRQRLQWKGKIYPFFHVDNGSTKRTYFVSKTRWGLLPT